MHSTNYFNTLICPSKDCQAVAVVPEKPGTIAALQFDLLSNAPYGLTSDDVLSAVAARRKGVDAAAFEAFRIDFFSKGQACFRASPLTKTHGWAIHADANGCVALVSPDGPDFARMVQDTDIEKVWAMRRKRL